MATVSRDFEEAEVWGDLDSEALAYARSSREVWRSTPGALELLEEAGGVEPPDEGETWLYVWRERATKEPELIRFTEAREDLLAARARDFDLGIRLAISPRGFRVFCVKENHHDRTDGPRGHRRR